MKMAVNTSKVLVDSLLAEWITVEHH